LDVGFGAGFEAFGAAFALVERTAFAGICFLTLFLAVFLTGFLGVAFGRAAFFAFTRVFAVAAFFVFTTFFGLLAFFVAVFFGRAAFTAERFFCTIFFAIPLLLSGLQVARRW
jgi:hypothetical protein